MSSKIVRVIFLNMIQHPRVASISLRYKNIDIGLSNEYLVTIAFTIRPWFHKCCGVRPVNGITIPLDN